MSAGEVTEASCAYTRRSSVPVSMGVTLESGSFSEKPYSARCSADTWRSSAASSLSEKLSSVRRSSSSTRKNPSSTFVKRKSLPLPSQEMTPRDGKLLLGAFEEPPLTLVQVDLLYVQITTTARRGKQLGQGRMTLDEFVWALIAITMYCQHEGLLEQSQKLENPLTVLYNKVLVHLIKLLGLDEQNAQAAALVLAEPEVRALFQRGQRSLEAIFRRYASPGGVGPYGRGHWTALAMKRFATEHDLVAEVSHPALQRLFNECVRHESKGRGVDGKMSFACFHLAIVMLAQRVHSSSAEMPLARIALLMLRLSVCKYARELGPIALAVLGDKGTKACCDGISRIQVSNPQSQYNHTLSFTQ